MALKSCRECKSTVSSKAKACPSCGISRPVKSSGNWAWILFGIIVIIMIFGQKNEDGLNHEVTNQPAKNKDALASSNKKLKNSATTSTEVNRQYVNCLSEKAKSGTYISNDGGKSAIRLVGACEAEWHEWSDRCIADGGTDGDCALKAGLLAQAALKLSGK